MKRILGILLVGAHLVACDGCQKTTRLSPLSYVQKDAEAVVEIRDIASAQELPAYVEKHLGTVITKSQIASLQEELRLTVGFDPTTKEGLKKAGIAASGPVAAALASDGTGALWIVPVDAPKLLRPIVDKQIAARVGATKVAKEKVGAHEVTTLSSEFGPKVITRAAYAFHAGFVFMGFGPAAKDRVQTALSTTEKTSVQQHPEFAALKATLGETFHLRVIAPGGGAALSGILRTITRIIPRAPRIDLPLEENVRGAGWVFRLDPGALTMKGRVRLDEKGLAAQKKIFTPARAVGPGVVSLDLPDVVVHVQAAGDPKALTEILAPPNSRARARLDAVYGRIKSDVNTDVEAEILPLLSGHAALGVGVGKLDGISFRQLVGNPRGVLWTAFALGADEPQSIVAMESRLDAGLEARNLTITPRKFNNIDVRSIGQPAGNAALVETFALPKAWVFSNEPVVSERVILNGSGRDRLNGKSGINVELRLKTLASELAKFDQKTLPLLWRGMVTKGLDLVKLFERAEMNVTPAADGLDVNGGLVFAK